MNTVYAQNVEAFKKVASICEALETLSAHYTSKDFTNEKYVQFVVVSFDIPFHGAVDIVEFWSKYRNAFKL